MNRFFNGSNMSFPINGMELYEESLKNTTVISTGCTSLDTLLEGGLWTGEVVEITGPPGCGKTQAWLTAAANLLSATANSLFIIDPNGSFVCERLLEIIAQKKTSCTPQILEDCLSRVNYLHSCDAMSVLAELLRIEKELISKASQFYCKMKLLVLDAVTPLISPILGGGQTHGHMLMMELGRALKRLAVEYNIAVMVINNSVLDRDSPLQYKPALGKSWRMVPHSRVLFNDVNETSRHERQYQATLIKTNKKGTNDSVFFGINKQGLVNSY